MAIKHSKDMGSHTHIFIINEGRYSSFDNEGSTSYKEMGVEETLIDFVTRRLKHFGFNSYSFIKSIDDIKAKETDYSAIINIVNPITDIDLLEEMIRILENYPHYDACNCEGAIPGTEVDVVIKNDKLKKYQMKNFNTITFKHDTQEKYNNQFNLRKLKRIKMFIHLNKFIKNLSKLSVSAFIEKLHQNDIFEKLAGYFEDVNLVYIKRCPCCESELQPIFPNVSQPTMGYFPFDKPYHYRCLNCKLIIVSPYVDGNDSDKLYDFYCSEGQGTQYFLDSQYGHKHYHTAVSIVKDHLPSIPKVLDIGTGAGAFIYYVKRNCPAWDIEGCDLGERVEYFKYDDSIRILNLNFVKDDIGNEKYNLITAWEVLEHIPFSEFKQLLLKAYNALKPGGIFIFSTPDFDSPLCQGFDFHISSPPQHMLIFSRSWIKFYFTNHRNFSILNIDSESEMLSTYEGWFNYWKNTSKHFQSRAMAKFMCELFNDDESSKAIHRLIKKKGWGAEMIVALQKKKTE
jgi:2-polyprenyl-3-methyl-5-hydroxy-6-metoxy-1,4-benzoquinol methylase